MLALRNMKKLLAIIVLGLILQGCATVPSNQVQKEWINAGVIKIGMNMNELYSVVKGGETFTFAPNRDTNPKYLFITTSNPWFSSKNSGQAYLGEATNSNPLSNLAAWTTMNGWKLENYRLIKIYDKPLPAYEYMISLEKDPKRRTLWLDYKKRYIANSVNTSNTSTSAQTITNSNTIKSSSLSSSERILQAKQACADLGFKPKTEKFADCALKFVTLDFERTTSAKNEPQVVIHKNDVNVWDELGVLFRQQGIIQDTSRPVNTRTNMRCTSSKTGFGQVVTNCR